MDYLIGRHTDRQTNRDTSFILEIKSYCVTYIQEKILKIKTENKTSKTNHISNIKHQKQTTYPIYIHFYYQYMYYLQICLQNMIMLALNN